MRFIPGSHREEALRPHAPGIVWGWWGGIGVLGEKGEDDGLRESTWGVQ